MSADMRDLIERLQTASVALDRLAAKEHDYDETARLWAKADGVRLALSFAEEYVR